MALDPNTVHHIGKWLLRLASITNQRIDDQLTPERITDYAAILGKHLPSAAFNSESLEAVVYGHEWFPPVEHIRKAVSEWWARNKPATAPVPALTHEGRVAECDLDDMALAWVRYYHRRLAEGPAAIDLRGVKDHKAHLLSLVKSQSLDAWHHLTGTPKQRWTAASDRAKAEVSAALARMREPAPAPRGQTVATRPAPEPRRYEPKPVCAETLDAIRANAGIGR